MKSYDQALNEIYRKANESQLRMRARRKQIKKILLTAASFCLILMVSLTFGIGQLDKHPHPSPSGEGSNIGTADIIENDPNTGESIDDLTEETNGTIEIGIYPHAWRGMNGVIVKWGEPNGETWEETVTLYYSGPNYSMRYIGIEVEFLEVYSETMSESLIPDIEGTIGGTSYLLIPERCLEYIKTGDTALVFLDMICRLGMRQDADGNLRGEEEILGVKLGNYVPGIKDLSDAPIFPIADGRVIVSEDKLFMNDRIGEYYMSEMELLGEANKLITKKGADCAIFENGMPADDLGDYFFYICNG